MNKKQIYSNYKRNNRFLGIIDYKSLTFLVVYCILIWNIVNFFNISLEYKVYLFLILIIPIIAIFCVNINEESAFDILIIIIKYLFRRKKYVCTNYLKIEYNDKFYKKYIKIS